MDVEWHEAIDLLAGIRAEMRTSRPEDQGRLLRDLAAIHADCGGDPARVDVEGFADIALALLRHASLFERMAFADAVADGGRVSPRLREALLTDVHLVARPLLERARLGDADLLGVIDAGRDESTLVTIAERRGVSVAVSDRLIDTARPKVLLALVRNAAAAISAEGFARFGMLAAGQGEMDTALAQRADLPMSIAKALHQRIGARAQKRVADMIARDRLRQRRPLVLGRP